MTLFVDTSALLPILNKDDRDYPQARRIWEHLAAERAVLLTSSYVLVESLALIQNRLGMEAVRDFQETFAPLIQVVWVTEELHWLGIAALLAANHRQLSLVDCVSFAVCRLQQIEQVFAFDGHFTEQGFSRLAV